MDQKLRVGILGATGMVGQRFIALLENHPWFEVVTLAASPRSAGKTYEEAVGDRWKMDTPMPEAVKKIVVHNVNEVEEVAKTVDFVFSAVDMSKDEIRAIEEAYAKTETPVVSNNSAHRWTPDVPMVIPEVNPEHFAVIEDQKKRLGTTRGFIAVKPNCSIQSYAPCLAAWKEFGPKELVVTTYQAISGAGKTFKDWPEMVENIIDLDDWDPVISKNDKLLEKYIVGEKLTIQELMYEEYRCVKKGSLFPIYHGSARNNIGTQQLIEAISNLFCSEMNENDSELCGRVFKIEYTDHKQRLVYLRLYSGTLHLRDTIVLSEKKKVKLTEIYIPSNGEMIQTEIVCSGDIFIIPNNTLRLNDIIGNEKILPCNVWNDKPVPMLRTRIEPIKIEEREKLLDALTEIADTDPLLRYCVDTITHEIVISFLGTVQLEVICSLLIEKYHINIRIEDPTVIYLEKPLQKADYTIHIEVPPNPFWASIGLSITPLPIGSGIQYESKVSLGYLNQSFQNAVREGINYGLEQGLYGWEVTDCKICFEYGVYYSPVSTPSDFRFLAPIVLEQTLKKAGTQLLEPYLSFILFTPQGYLSRAYNDAQKHCAIIETSQSKNDEIIFTGHIPVRCINEYRNTLTLYTNGQAVFLTELKDYQIATCEPVIQSRRPNNRIDKVRHMFNKKEN